jgi:hypothetical protein
MGSGVSPPPFLRLPAGVAQANGIIDINFVLN